MQKEISSKSTLIDERGRLETKCNKLEDEKRQLELKYEQMEDEKDALDFEKKKLESEKAKIVTERDGLEEDLESVSIPHDRLIAARSGLTSCCSCGMRCGIRASPSRAAWQSAMTRGKRFSMSLLPSVRSMMIFTRFMKRRSATARGWSGGSRMLMASLTVKPKLCRMYVALSLLGLIDMPQLKLKNYRNLISSSTRRTSPLKPTRSSNRSFGRSSLSSTIQPRRRICYSTVMMPLHPKAQVFRETLLSSRRISGKGMLPYNTSGRLPLLTNRP